MTFNPAFFDHSNGSTQREFTFDSVDNMRSFTNQLKSNPFVTGNELLNRNTLSVTARDGDSMTSISQIYDTITGS
jgi:hypothetical protein